MTANNNIQPGTPPVLEEEEQGLQIDIYLDVVKRHWLLLVCIAVIVSGAVMIKRYTRPPIYQANGMLMIESGSSGGTQVFPDPLTTARGGMNENLSTQVRLLKSRRMAKLVVEELGLIKPIEKTEKIESGESRIRLTKDDEKTIQARRLSFAITHLQNRLLIAILPSTRLVAVSYSHHNPKMAALIINTLFKKYIDFNLLGMSESTKQAADFFATQLKDLKEELSKKEEKLQEYGKQKELFYISGKDTAVVEKFALLNKDLTNAQINRLEQEAVYLELKKKKFEDFPEVMNHPLILGTKKDYAKLASLYKEKSLVYKENYPEMLGIQSQMNSLLERLADETEEIGQKLLQQAKDNYTSARKKEIAIAKLLDKQKNDLSETNTNAIFYQNLKIEVENMRHLLSQLVKKQNETMITARLEDLRASNIKIIDWAEVPVAPRATKDGKIIMMSVSAGVGLALALIFALDFLFKTLYNPNEVEKVLKAVPLGAIPALEYAPAIPQQNSTAPPPHRQSYNTIDNTIDNNIDNNNDNNNDSTNDNNNDTLLGSLKKRFEKKPEPPELDFHQFLDLESRYTDTFRQIRTSFLLTTPPPMPTSITFTSALPGEGKSSAIVNMAVSFTRLKKKVLIIDSNFHNPTIHRCFNQTPQSGTGLSAILQGTGTYGEALCHTEYDNLYVLPAGPMPPSPFETLNSGAMEELINNAKQQFDYVLIDAPAMEDNMEPVVIANYSDAVIITAWAASTLKRKIQGAIDELQKYPNIRVLGVLLNKVGMNNDWQKQLLKLYRTIARKLW
jgi:polysaccharide biosynthesis transport protein